MGIKPKKMKIDFEKPDNQQKPADSRDIFLDNSASELQKLQQDMEQRRNEDRLKEEAEESNIGSLGYKEEPSYASQNVPAEVSQRLNVNESNIDSQQAIKQAALEKLISQAGTLTPMNQKIAEGMGGIGSIKNVAAKAIPLAERASASFLQKAGPEAKSFPGGRPEQYAHMEDAAKQARLKAMELENVSPYTKDSQLASKEAFRLEQAFNKYRDMFGKQIK